MSHTKLYTAIYGVLFVVATVQVGIERAALVENYWLLLGVIIALSVVKAAFVANYYMHMKWEPRSIAYLMGMALVAVLALTVAASYSIQ